MDSDGELCGNRAFLVGRTDWTDEPRLGRLDKVRDASATRSSTCEATRSGHSGRFRRSPARSCRFVKEAVHDVGNCLFHPTQTGDWNEDGTITERFRAGGVDEMC